MLAGTFLTACSETTSEDPANVSSEVSADAAETVPEEVEVNPLEELPVEDYGGANYHILGDTNSNWWIISLNSEEITGEIINDTVYERNQFVEERYNVNVTSQETTAAVTELQMAVQANSDDYSVVWERINTLIPTAQAGNLKNLKGFSAFNLEAPWWDVDSVKALAINDKLFFACNAQRTRFCAAGEDHGAAVHGAVVRVQREGAVIVSGQTIDAAEGHLCAGVHGMGTELVAQFQPGDSGQSGIIVHLMGLGDLTAEGLPLADGDGLSRTGGIECGSQACGAAADDDDVLHDMHSFVVQMQNAKC